MEPVAIVTVLILIQYFYFSLLVGFAHNRTGISAPTMTGDPDLERHVRVHMNTAEQLILLLPLMWIFAYYVHELAAAGIGLLFIVSRFMYYFGYIKDPVKRGPGFGLGFSCIVVLAVGSLIGASMAWAG